MSIRELTSLEWSVINAVRFDSRISAKTTATRCKIHTHSVHRVTRSLVSRGVLKSFLLVNPHALGLTDYCIFLRIINGDQKFYRQLLKLCNSDPQIVYWAELSGEYQFTLSIFASDAFAVELLIAQIEAFSSQVTITAHFAIRLRWDLLLPSSSNTNLTRGHNTQLGQVSNFDRQLIETYALQPDQTFVALAQKLQVSEGAIRKRIARLLHDKVIIGVPYLFNSANCGLFPFRALLKTKGSRQELGEQLLDFCKKSPVVTDFVQCLGSWDFEINFFVSQPTEISAFTQVLYELIPDRIYSITTINEVSLNP